MFLILLCFPLLPADIRSKVRLVETVNIHPVYDPINWHILLVLNNQEQQHFKIKSILINETRLFNLASLTIKDVLLILTKQLNNDFARMQHRNYFIKTNFSSKK